MYQRYISGSAKVNSGKLLSNPISRVNILFDANTKINTTPILDKSKRLKNSKGKKVGYETAQVNGEPITVDNINEFITPKSKNDLVIKLCVCLSGVGISVPVSAHGIVVERAESRDEQQKNICNLLYGDSDSDTDSVKTLESASKELNINDRNVAANNGDYSDLE